MSTKEASPRGHREEEEEEAAAVPPEGMSTGDVAVARPPVDAEAGWTADMDAYVAKASKEDLLSLYIHSRDAQKTLGKDLRVAIAPTKQAAATAKAAVLEGMAATGVDVVPVASDCFVRRCIRAVSGKAVNVPLVSAVWAAVFGTQDAFAARVQAVLDAREHQLHTFKASKAGTAAARKASLLEQVRCAEAGPPLPAAPAVAASTGPLPAVRYTGKGGLAPARSCVPTERDLTVAEVLAEVVYGAIHEAHKPKRPTLMVTTTPGGRGAKGKAAAAAAMATLASSIPEPLHAAAAAFSESRHPGAGNPDVEAIRLQLKQLRHVVTRLNPEVTQYLHELSGAELKAVRAAAPPPGSTTAQRITVYVKPSVRGPRSLKLFEVSSVLDTVIEESVSLKTTFVSADTAFQELQPYLPGLFTAFTTAMTEFLEARRTTVPTLCMRKVSTRPHRVDGTEGGGDGTAPAPEVVLYDEGAEEYGSGEDEDGTGPGREDDDDETLEM